MNRAALICNRCSHAVTTHKYASPSQRGGPRGSWNCSATRADGKNCECRYAGSFQERKEHIDHPGVIAAQARQERASQISAFVSCVECDSYHLRDIHTRWQETVHDRCGGCNQRTYALRHAPRLANIPLGSTCLLLLERSQDGGIAH
jgi:hypothetical protein